MDDTARQQVNWRSRIVKTGKIRASQLHPHSDNPKVHPVSQQKAVAGSISELGQIAPILINAHNGELVDGHERAWLALAQADDVELDAVWVDLTDEEHAKALLMLDYTARLALYDRDKVDTLLHTVNTDKPDVQRLLSEIATKHGYGLPRATDDTIEETPPTEIGRWDVPDALFPTDNEWGVPLLDSTLQAQTLDLPVTKWGVVSRKSRIGGTLHFYTDDYKFNALWDDPSPVVNSAASALIEPNFSTGVNMPRAVVLWGVYRKRWLARWWQTYGIRVFVDLNIEREFFDLALLGVPAGWNAYANRAYTDDMIHLEEAYTLAEQHAGKTPLYVVIGGRQSVRELCMRRGWLWVAEDSARARQEEVAHGTG